MAELVPRFITEEEAEVVEAPSKESAGVKTQSGQNAVVECARERHLAMVYRLVQQGASRQEEVVQKAVHQGQKDAEGPA